MPFDINDPLGLGQLPIQQPRPQPLPPITPQEQQSLLDKIGSAGLGGLSFVAGILNKPGRVVRGLLGGKPREALNAIPFSDALGITDPGEEVHGQDILGAKDAPFLSPEGIAGFGVDVLTDPLTYLSFAGHALTKLGQTAAKAGIKPAGGAARAAGVFGSDAFKVAAKAAPLDYAANPIFAAADVAGQKLGGHVGFGLPFSGGNQFTANLAPAASWLKRGVSAVPGGESLLRGLGAVGGAIGNTYTKIIPPLFESAVKGRTTRTGQDIAREISAGTPGAIASAKMAVMPLAQQQLEHGISGSTIRSVAETGANPDWLLQSGVNDVQKPVQSIVDQTKGLLAEDLKQNQAMGLPNLELHAQEIRSGAGEGKQLGFMPRKTEPPQPVGLDYLRSKRLTPRTEPGRMGEFDGLTTEQINQMAADTLGQPGSKASTVQQIQQTIEDKYLNVPKQRAAVNEIQAQVSADLAAHQGVPTDMALQDKLTKAQAVQATLESQAAELAKMKVNGALPTFANEPVQDVAAKLAKSNVDRLIAGASYKGLAGAATRQASEETTPIMEMLADFWKPMDIAQQNTVDAAGKIVGRTPPIGAQTQMAAALGVPISELKNFHVPTEIAKDVAGLTRMHTLAGMDTLLKVWDSVTNLTKAGQTMFPATVGRNIIQDWYNKLVYGAKYADQSGPLAYIKPYQDWKVIANGGTVPGLAEKLQNVSVFRGLDDATASSKLRELYTAWDIGRENFKRTSIMQAGAELGAEQPGRFAGLIPSTEQAGPLAAYSKGLKEGDLNALGVSGFMGQNRDTFKPVKAMRAANNANDNLQRGSSWLAYLTQGMEPQQAFDQMMKAHYDFGNMSQFERSVMRRVMPFYSWARQNIPAVVKEIGENPGGLVGKSVNLTEAMKGPNPGFVPQQLQGGVAAPLGGEENGQQRYLSRLGLSFEDLGSLGGPGGPLGMLNPLIKAPIEQITGKQMFTGRDLRDLHSRLGDLTGQPLPTAENLLMNSPAGRVLSTVGTLADPRKTLADKAVNSLTGARLEDVNVEQARRNAVRDYITEQLHGPGIRQISDINVKPDNLGGLTPLQQQLYQLYRQQNAQPARRAPAVSLQ